MAHAFRSSIFIVGLSLVVSSATAQKADTLITQGVLLASFNQARALGVDPSGKLYVVDGGRDAVIQLGTEGQVLATMGGPGTEDGQFDDPRDVDPTNGLIWVVADAGNSRLQRFSRTFMHVGTLPVARVSRFKPGTVNRTLPIGEEGAVHEADGRPIAVAVSNANEIYAIEETQGVVLKWDASRRLVGAIGGYDAGDGALVEPVALATDATSLYVADPGRQAVMVYDLFGAYVRALADGRASDVRAVTVAGNELWIVLPERLLLYETRGRLLQVFDVKLGESLVDVAVRGGYIYLLTSTRLLRVSR